MVAVRRASPGVALIIIARRLQRGAARHVTWGCGYTAPNTRMQYTGTSFSLQFARVFETFLPQLRREKLIETRHVCIFASGGHERSRKNLAF